MALLGLVGKHTATEKSYKLRRFIIITWTCAETNAHVHGAGRLPLSLAAGRLRARAEAVLGQTRHCLHVAHAAGALRAAAAGLSVLAVCR